MRASEALRDSDENHAFGNPTTTRRKKEVTKSPTSAGKAREKRKTIDLGADSLQVCCTFGLEAKKEEGGW